MLKNGTSNISGFTIDIYASEKATALYSYSTSVYLGQQLRVLDISATIFV